MFTRVPSRRSDWVRLEQYAARIREVCVYEAGLPGLDIIPYFRIYLPHDFVLLPNIQILHWRGTDRPSSFYYSSLLLSASLRDCSLETDVHGIVSTLHSMQRECAALRRLSILTRTVDITPMVSSFIHLTYFNFFCVPSLPINELTIQSLAPLPYLVEWITNGLMEKDTLKNIAVSGFEVFFPSLKLLSLHGEDLDSIAGLLSSTQSTSLCSFTYTHNGRRDPKPSAIRRLMDSIARHDTLDDLFLSSTSSLRTSFADLESLTELPIRKIRLFNIVSNLELSNESFIWLTQGWPNLESFYCCNDDTPVGPLAVRQLPTPEIFRHFAVNCPRLIHLSLTVDVMHIPVREEDEVLPSSSGPLYFHPHAMLLSRRGDLYRMVGYITDIYPKLSLRLSDDIGYSDPDTVEILDEVNSLIPTLIRPKTEGQQKRTSVATAADA